MMRLRDAHTFGRLLCGHALNGELQGVAEAFRPLAESLAALPPEDRRAAWDLFLAGRPDREEIIAVVARIDPNGPPPDPEAEPNEQRGLATTCLADIRPEPIRWQVPGYLPLGKLIILAGEGGYGKTTLTLHLTAQTTRGWSCFGLSYTPPEPADVLLISCEDDYADTVVPRLMSAGADLRRVHRVDGIEVEDGRPGVFTLAHLDRMECELGRRPGVRLVIIDPVGGYVGRAGMDDNREAELRAVLDPLAELAARRSVLVVLVKHLSKDQSRKAAQRVGGSAAYVNASRAAFIVAPDPDDGDRRLFLPIKFNCGPWPSGLAFRMDALPPEERAGILAGMDHLGDEDRNRLAQQLYRITWQGPVSISADDALRADTRQKPTTADADKAAAWLRERLSDGPAGSTLCAIQGNAAIGRRPHRFVTVDVKWWRENVLKLRLGGKSRKLGMEGPWFFTLPDGPWPPSNAAILAARDAESAPGDEETDAPTEGSEESDESRSTVPREPGFIEPEPGDDTEVSEESRDVGRDSSGPPADDSARRNPAPSDPSDADSSDPSASSGSRQEGGRR